MSTTLAQLRTQYYSILNVSPGNNFPITIANEQINRAEMTILTSNPKDMKTGNAVQKPKLPFLDKYVFFTSAQDVYLASNASIWDTALTVGSTSGYPTSGALWMNGDIITYTGITSTQFTGISALGFAWQTGTRVALLYNIPSDSAQILELRLPRVNLAVEFRNYDNILKINRETPYQMYTGGVYNILDSLTANNSRRNTYYTIIWAQYILLIAYNDTSAPIQLRYAKNPTTMVADTDVCTIPDKYAMATIPFFAAAEAYALHDQPDQALAYNQYAIQNIKEMYNFYVKQDAETTAYNRIKTGKDTMYLRI